MVGRKKLPCEASHWDKDRNADREDHQCLSDDSITQQQLASAENQLGTFSVLAQETKPSQPHCGEEGDRAEDRESKQWGSSSHLGAGRRESWDKMAFVDQEAEAKQDRVRIRVLTFEDQGAKAQQTPRNLG